MPRKTSGKARKKAKRSKAHYAQAKARGYYYKGGRKIVKTARAKRAKKR